MAIPEQVKKQSEAVQQLYSDLNTEEGVEAQPTGKLSIVEDVQADRVKEQAIQSAPEEQEEAGTQNDKTIEQKYKTLQGMYNAEVPRLHADKRDLEDRIGSLEQLLGSVANQPTPTAEQQTSKSVNLITDQDIEDYGDSIDVMRRVSKEESNTSNQRIAQLEQVIQQLQSNVLPKVDMVANQQAQNNEQAFWSDLSYIVPEWQDINNNPDFQTWLLSTDPLTGISRQTYLEDAQSNFDSHRVANFFSSWADVNGTPQAQTTASPASQLEKQVSPGKGKNTGTFAGTNDQTYTPDDIKVFFEQVRLGHYKGNDSERAKIERDIFAAQQDGRIINA
jgi:hypothetical protein